MQSTLANPITCDAQVRTAITVHMALRSSELPLRGMYELFTVLDTVERAVLQLQVEQTNIHNTKRRARTNPRGARKRLFSRTRENH